MNPFSDIFLDLSKAALISSIVDITIVFYIIYRVMLLIKGTRALQMLIGVFLTLGLYLISNDAVLGLTTLHWILEKFVSYFLVILIILFQPDIRRALSQVGRNPLFLTGNRKAGTAVYEEVIKAAMRLSDKRLGALIVLEKEADLTPFTEEAIAMDAQVTADTLFSIFIPTHENPLHDGAVIIREGRISHAACFLPLTENQKIDKNLGTRHRAAIGLTEATDAVVVVVSEETGTVSICDHGEIRRGFDARSLRDALMDLFGPGRRKGHE
ncbi:MAG TPA: diadenylate cyclase CdaA [Myxococcota bacterium]|nr:diadenylate cyclase CdaA [Myxococcota bacterium]